MSNSLGRLVFASPTADMRAHDIKIKRHRRLWIDTQDCETSKLLKPLKPNRSGAVSEWCEGLRAPPSFKDRAPLPFRDGRSASHPRNSLVMVNAAGMMG